MFKFLHFVLGGILCFGPTMIAGAQAMRSTATRMPASSPTSAQVAYKDIENTLGFVPEFLKSYPEAGIAGAWQEMKSLQMNPKTALTGKQKELIGLAVSAQIPCVYCVYFHTKAAKANGATDMQIKEAVAMSALTRHWSTWLNGTAGNMATFRQEVDRGMQFIKAKMDANEKMPEAPANMNTAEAVYADISRIFGFVPAFYRNFPADGIVGAWKAQRDLELNPKTALTGKEKSLIGIAVAAQIPCHYCNYFDTQAATILEGATDKEIKEAIAMASIVRHWSTVLNGNQISEPRFRGEVDRIFAKPVTRPMRTGSGTQGPTTEEEQ